VKSTNFEALERTH